MGHRNSPRVVILPLTCNQEDEEEGDAEEDRRTMSALVVQGLRDIIQSDAHLAVGVLQELKDRMQVPVPLPVCPWHVGPHLQRRRGGTFGLGSLVEAGDRGRTGFLPEGT